MLTEELQHFQLVKESIERLGGDPTIVSSSPETSAVASLGLVQVLGGPRVPLRHTAHAILIAELADNDGWTMLIDVATAMGLDSMAADFRAARVVEDEHLARVRGGDRPPSPRRAWTWTTNPVTRKPTSARWALH
jgi:hypothetical protein